MDSFLYEGQLHFFDKNILLRLMFQRLQFKERFENLL